MTEGTILSRVFLKFWRRIKAANRFQKHRGVFLHDPAAERPHDLDDPFFDNNAQARMGKAIANAKENKRVVE